MIDIETDKEICLDYSTYKVFGYNEISLDYLNEEIFVQNIYYFEASTNQPVIIDCGANIGMSVIYFKKLFPRAEITAFEANPFAFKLLVKNLKTNELEDVKLHNVALYDEEAEISLYMGNYNKATPLCSIRNEIGTQNQIKAKTRKLSDFIGNLDRIDLIKIDVEGAELQVINDLFDSKLIKKAEKYIIEYHLNLGSDKSTLSDFLKKFESNGFNYNIKANFSRTNFYQDLLIYFYKQT